MKIISGKIEKAQKVVIYGPEGIGKSTFASKFPDPLFIDTEGSTFYLDVKRFEEIKSYADMIGAITYVGKNPDICKTLVIDTMDWAERMIADEVTKENGWKSIEDPGYGKGYAVLAEKVQGFLRYLSRITELGINAVIVAHAMMRKFELPDEAGAYDRWELKLQRRTAPIVKEWADAVLFLNYETSIVNKDKSGKGKAMGGERVLYANHRPTFDAKNRWGLGDHLTFSFDTISPFIMHAKDATKIKKEEPVKEENPEMEEEKEEEEDGLE